MILIFTHLKDRSTVCSAITFVSKMQICSRTIDKSGNNLSRNVDFMFAYAWFRPQEMQGEPKLCSWTEPGGDTQPCAPHCLAVPTPPGVADVPSHSRSPPPSVTPSFQTSDSLSTGHCRSLSGKSIYCRILFPTLHQVWSYAPIFIRFLVMFS